MGAKRTDISKVRKYLNGELDARAMHKLEREALDDPFLMDALEGFEQNDKNPQKNIGDLEARLQQRISSRKKARVLPWQYLSVAASVLVIFTLTYVFWPNDKLIIKAPARVAKIAAPVPVNADSLAPVLKPADKSLLAAVKPGKQTAPKAAFNTPVIKADHETAASGNVLVDSPAIAEMLKKASGLAVTTAPDKRSLAGTMALRSKNDTTGEMNAAYFTGKAPAKALNEIVINGFAAPKKKAVTGSVAGVTQQALQGKVAGVQVSTPERRINGIIMDDSGQPLPGVYIGVLGANTGVHTDVNGRFSISAKGTETLDVRYIGYLSQQIKAKTDDSLKISLHPSNEALAEVAVTGLKPTAPDKHAHPHGGWAAFNRYLKQNAFVVKGEKTGTVKLSFMVNADGSLSDFVIIKGLTEAADKAAIALIKGGPKWTPRADHQPKTIKLRIRFITEKQ